MEMCSVQKQCRRKQYDSITADVFLYDSSNEQHSNMPTFTNKRQPWWTTGLSKSLAPLPISNPASFHSPEDFTFRQTDSSRSRSNKHTSRWERTSLHWEWEMKPAFPVEWSKTYSINSCDEWLKFEPHREISWVWEAKGRSHLLGAR